MAAPRHDWHLKQWLRTLGKIQADVSRDLDMNKAKVSLMANGKQPYTRDEVNEIADYLNLQPYELLMHPADAMAIRQLRASAETIATLAHENDLLEETEHGEAMGKRELARQANRSRSRKTGTRD